MKILIAEDDPISRELLKKILGDWGYEVITAENGKQALDLVKDESIKFVIADWIMPLMDGLALCRQIRLFESSGYVYFILFTGKDRKEDIIEGLNAGADDYVVKPIERDELRVRVRAGERILTLERELTEKNESLRNLNNKLEEIACMDTLMEIGNRRSFYNTIEKVHRSAIRYDKQYSIIMCDIDNFKTYNDTYGHLAGDQALKTVAKAMKLSLRASEEIFRFGGEELVIIIPDHNLDSTYVVAERLRKNIEALGIEHLNANMGIITISCGVSTFDKKAEHVKWEDVLEYADRALYAAKAAGRNQVRTAHNLK